MGHTKNKNWLLLGEHCLSAATKNPSWLLLGEHCLNAAIENSTWLLLGEHCLNAANFFFYGTVGHRGQSPGSSQPHIKLILQRAKPSV